MSEADLRGGSYFKDYGVYGEADRAQYQPRLRKASVLENRRLSQQKHFTYFIPFLPLAICPSAPDIFSEFCVAYGRDIEIVYWDLDYQLVPSLLKRDIDTSKVFGVAGVDGKMLPNFARGVVLQDEGTQSVYRLLVEQFTLLEPGVSLARPAEKILADRFTVQVLWLQSPQNSWRLKLNDPPAHFLVYKDMMGDPGLWTVAKRFWTRGGKTDILEDPNLGE